MWLWRVNVNTTYLYMHATAPQKRFKSGGGGTILTTSCTLPPFRMDEFMSGKKWSLRTKHKMLRWLVFCMLHTNPVITSLLQSPFPSKKLILNFFLKKKEIIWIMSVFFFFNRTGIAQAYTLTYFCHLPDSAEVNMSFSVHWNILF